MENEIWKDIIGYENLYQASNLGRIKSNLKIVNKGKWGIVTFPEIILKQTMRTKNNYLCVNLYKDKKVKLYSTHRLIALTFIPNLDNKPQVNHKNGIKTDNRVENIEWNTSKENCIHAVDNKLTHAPKGEKNGQSKLKNQDILLIRNSRYKISRKKLSKMFNVSIKHIDRIRAKSRWKHI